MEALLTNIDITNLPQEILIATPGLSNAVANDGQDDAAAFQAAIDFLTDQREGGFTDESTIYIPDGVFDLGKTLEVNSSDISFKGAGKGVTILKNADVFQIGTTGLPDSGTRIGSINRDAYLFDLDRNAVDVTFTDMTLTGPEVHGAIFGFKAHSLEISDVEFNNFLWSSVRLFNLSDVKIHDNVFIDAGGRARGTSGPTGGSIYATYLRDSEIYNNDISKSEENVGNVFGIKGRQFTNTRIHHNTINTNFAIELPFENDRFVEIDHNFLSGVVSIPKHAGGTVPEDGFTFHIHHNYFTKSYSLEWARNGVEIDHNVFNFDSVQDNGNLITNHGNKSAPGLTKFHNNLIINPGRGIFWSKGIYNDFSFYNNEVVANTTVTPRLEGFFGFNQDTDFSTIEIRDNIIRSNGISRPLMRNEASYDSSIENNTLINISDIDQFENPNTNAPRGLLAPLAFQVGVGGSFNVDSSKLNPTDEITTATRVKIEAEDIANLPNSNVFGYRIENKRAASRGQNLTLRGKRKQELGTVALSIDDLTGLLPDQFYDIRIGVFDENDGESIFSLQLNGMDVPDASIVLNDNLGSHAANANTLVTRTLGASLLLQAGDILTIVGGEQGGEHARIDFVELRPSLLP